MESVRAAVLTVSDGVSAGTREDRSGDVAESALRSGGFGSVERSLVPDERGEIEARLKDLTADGVGLIVTTGGTGFGPRDVTPEATLAVADKVMPGFGEQMRQISLKFVATAILSRQVAVIRKGALIINLPGQPKSIRETLEGLKDAGVHGIFSAVPYCIDLIGGPYIETHEAVVKAFRPKSAQRKPA